MQALEWARKNRFRSSELYALLSLGKTYEEEGDTALARKCYEEVVTAPDPFCIAPTLWEASYRIGILAEAAGNREEALGWYIDAISCIESYKQGISLQLLQFAFVEDRILPYEKLIGLLSRMHEEAGGDEEIVEMALEYADRSKVKRFERKSRARGSAPDGSRAQDLLGRKEKILENLNLLRKEYLFANLSPAEKERVQREIEDLRVALTEVKMGVELLGERDYDETQHADFTVLDEVRGKILDPSTCVIEYFVGKNATYAWLLSRDGIEMRELPHLSPRNHPALLYIQLLAGDLENHPRALGKRLYRDLLSPFEEKLGKAKTLIIVPDGALCYLPFEALPADLNDEPDGNLRFLVERFDISYGPSLSVIAYFLASARPGEEGEAKILAVGDPVGEEEGIFTKLERFFREGGRETGRDGYLSPGSGRFPRLKNSGNEVRRVAATFPEEGRKLLIGGAAHEAAVKQEPLSIYDVVHFATHGIYDDENPELSGLLLSSADDGEDDFLVADEIGDFDLDASLVVLSGCQTGLGRYVRGEGVLGLSRAFFEAGAMSTLVSLWEIGDASTADFMEEFYRAYRNGLGKRTALSTVKRNMIHRGMPASVWAPFILTGDPR